jgi:hypothetical protein
MKTRDEMAFAIYVQLINRMDAKHNHYDNSFEWKECLVTDAYTFADDFIASPEYQGTKG